MSYHYQEIAAGIGEYKSYVIYSFHHKEISVLESDSLNNTTYVFKYSNWETLSRKTRTEIIPDS